MIITPVISRLKFNCLQSVAKLVSVKAVILHLFLEISAI